MHETKTQIYSGMWVQLPTPVKNAIAGIFKIPRNGSSHVVDGHIQSDGYLDKDLSVLNVESLQAQLNSTEPDLFKLWDEFVNKVIKELNPAVEIPKEIKPNVEMNIKVDGEDVLLSGVAKRGRPRKTI